MKTVIVTRHPALVKYLIEQGVITKDQAAEVIAHATAEQVAGNHVIGVLPHSLSHLAESYTEVAIHAPAELRGVELSVEQVREFAQAICTYKVQKL
jgi:putative CRISPR-associated protein (TIGR02620 family)